MFSRLFNRRDAPVPIPGDDLSGPGPIERTRWAQRHFKRHGRWPAEVVEERLFRADLHSARMRRAWTHSPDPRSFGASEHGVLTLAREHGVDADGRVAALMNGHPMTACGTCGRFGPHVPGCPNA